MAEANFVETDDAYFCDVEIRQLQAAAHFTGGIHPGASGRRVAVAHAGPAAAKGLQIVKSSYSGFTNSVGAANMPAATV